MAHVVEVSPGWMRPKPEREAVGEAAGVGGLRHHAHERQLTPEQRAMRARIAGFAKSAKYDGVAGTDKARTKFLEKFEEEEVDPDRVLHRGAAAPS